MTDIQPLTPREQLIDRIRTYYEATGYSHDVAVTRAIDAVDAFYANDQTHPDLHLVTFESVQILLNVIPAFAINIRSALEAVSARAAEMIQAVFDAATPYSDMIGHAKLKTKDVPAVIKSFDASGLPAEDGPRLHLVRPKLEMLITDPVTGDSWEPVPGVLSVEFGGSVGDTPPDDRITGAPHHYIINGDHSACGCGGHDTSCQTWDDPVIAHQPTLCNLRRTFCSHTPSHTYGQPCDSDRTLDPEISRDDRVSQGRWASYDFTCWFRNKRYDSHDFTYGERCRRCNMPRGLPVSVPFPDDVRKMLTRGEQDTE